jgi:TatD DNase family protein
MSLMELIDSHCHLDVADFDADRQAVLARARNRAVTGIVVPGIQASGWKALLALCHDEAGLYPALGLHPVFLEQHQPADLRLLETELAAQRPVAVGEIGLDFQVDGLDHARQQQLFESQLAIASAAALPVILHVRKAHDQVLATLRRHRVRGGICHAFNGSLQQASKYSDLGFRLGFGGMLTFERSTRLRALAQALPLDALVLETDAPDMTVFQHHGERNSPEYLPYCLAALAAVRDEDPEAVARVTTANVREVLLLDTNVSHHDANRASLLPPGEGQDEGV